MAIMRVITEVVHLDLGETGSLGSADDACIEYRGEHFREDRDYVNFHGVSVPAIFAGELAKGMGENRE